MDTSINIEEFSGYDGVDVDIDISIFEYGIAWKEIPFETFIYGDKLKKKYEFIYGTEYGESRYVRFDRITMDEFEFLDLIYDSWIEVKNVLGFTGLTEKEFVDSFPHAIHDLYNYYGYIEIFGESYGGFKIDGLETGEEDANI